MAITRIVPVVVAVRTSAAIDGGRDRGGGGGCGGGRRPDRATGTTRRHDTVPNVAQVTAVHVAWPVLPSKHKCYSRRSTRSDR
jgi:hypothetical protein